MPTSIKPREITRLEPIRIEFGFAGLAEGHALAIIRNIIREAWPASKRPAQSVYAIRLVGEVAIAYGNGFSPVIYIGEGNAYLRLYQHANWLVRLLIDVPQLRVEVRIVEIARRNKRTLYKHVEADLLRKFYEEHAMLPWFNKQREKSKENVYGYEDGAWEMLRALVHIGSGTKFRWAIRPTKNNSQYAPYERGAG